MTLRLARLTLENVLGTRALWTDHRSDVYAGTGFDAQQQMPERICRVARVGVSQQLAVQAKTDTFEGQLAEAATCADITMAGLSRQAKC
jgi:hypothetical protein